jgi:lipoprotein-anchoring transpeptidase ErfK/SrfK
MIGKVYMIGVALLAGAFLSGCSPIDTQMATLNTHLSPRDKAMMALAPSEEWSIPIVRKRIADPTGEAPGTIVVDTNAHNLYYVLPGKQAIQYKVATGAEAYGWTGRAKVGRMAEWPQWMPTASIMQRWPEFKVYMKHGPLAGAYDNPLGARALYLYEGNHDTLYRIHGTNEPDEIGQGVSSGCIRMRDLDVIDLYSRVHVGTNVVVK